MYCSGCGQAIAAGQGFCPNCGRPIVVPVPTVPGLQFEVESYASQVKALAILWFVYAAVGFMLGLAGLTFAQAFFSHMGFWGRGPWAHNFDPNWLGPSMLHFIWVALIIRAALAVATGWVLLHHSQWGRILAIVVAVFSLIKFPFGTAIGIWTLVLLLGYRNTILYEQLQ